MNYPEVIRFLDTIGAEPFMIALHKSNNILKFKFDKFDEKTNSIKIGKTTYRFRNEGFSKELDAWSIKIEKQDDGSCSYTFNNACWVLRKIAESKIRRYCCLGFQMEYVENFLKNNMNEPFLLFKPY